MSLYGGVELPGAPDLDNVRLLDRLGIQPAREMMRTGMGIDKPFLSSLTSYLERRMATLRKDIEGVVSPDALDRFVSITSPPDEDDTEGDEPHDDVSINVQSSEQLATLLFDVLGLGTHKRLRFTNTGDRLSTGKKQLEMIKEEHPVVNLILDYRACEKLRSTYTLAIPKLALFHPRSKCCPICERLHKVSMWRIHSQILSTRASTGRYASKKINGQNIPIRSILGAMIREAFIAGVGRRTVGRDLSQIELRLAAHLANDPNMITIYVNNQDIHNKTTMAVFNISDESLIDKNSQRAPVKNLNFGIIYGLSEAGLYDQIALTYASDGKPMPTYITVDWCKAFIAKWFALYPAVKPYLDLQHYRAKRYGRVWDQIGRVRLVPEARSSINKVIQAGMRQAGNMPVQGLSSSLMRLILAEAYDECRRLRAEGHDVWLMNTIHDEVLADCDEDDAGLMDKLLERIMNNVMVDRQTGINRCRVPISSSGSIMTCWKK